MKTQRPDRLASLLNILMATTRDSAKQLAASKFGKCAAKQSRKTRRRLTTRWFPYCSEGAYLVINDLSVAFNATASPASGARGLRGAAARRRRRRSRREDCAALG